MRMGKKKTGEKKQGKKKQQIEKFDRPRNCRGSTLKACGLVVARLDTHKGWATPQQQKTMHVPRPPGARTRPVLQSTCACLKKQRLLRVHIAGLVDGAEYVALVYLARGDGAPVLKESRRVVRSDGEHFARVDYEVALPANELHVLVFEVYGAAGDGDDVAPRALLEAAKRSLVVCGETRQATFAPFNSASAHGGDESVGKKRSRPEEPEPGVKTPKTVKRSVNRQSDVLRCIVDQPVTERAILEQCGDNRYTREILRRLMALGSVARIGRGGANDPYRYRFLCTPEEAIGQGREDPAVSIRMQRFESKILALLDERPGFVTEKEIRSAVGDNTGTGKALRNLVKTSRVLRIGKGGVGDPFTYAACREQGEHSVGGQLSSRRAHMRSAQSDAHELSDCSTIASSKSSVADAADVHSHEENEVAHTLALLAAGVSSDSLLAAGVCSDSTPGPQERKTAASICEMYIAAAAALDAAA